MRRKRKRDSYRHNYSPEDNLGEKSRRSHSMTTKQSLMEHSHLLNKRDESYIYQKTQLKELATISLSQGFSLVGAYFYKPSAGRGITIYVIDTGFNAALLPEFTSARLRWIFPKTAEQGYRPWTSATGGDEGDLPDNHGTAMTSKAAGKDYGIAKLANVVVVRMQPTINDILKISFILITDALLKIENDVKAQGLQGKFVVNMSFS